MTDEVDEAGVEELRNAVIAFNVAATGYSHGASLGCLLRDQAGQLIAGLDGFTWGGYAMIEWLCLVAVAVLIGLMGVGNTLALSIHERTRELGLLRAVGQTRRQLRSTVRWESIIVAVFGTIGGLSVGTFLGWGLMRAINAHEGFGIFAAPTSSLAVILALAAMAGVLAAVRPARRAARLDILDAIATD